jgi:hypothetical protein
MIVFETIILQLSSIQSLAVQGLLDEFTFDTGGFL